MLQAVNLGHSNPQKWCSRSTADFMPLATVLTGLLSGCFQMICSPVFTFSILLTLPVRAGVVQAGGRLAMLSLLN